jgi:hypothetical protein
VVANLKYTNKVSIYVYGTLVATKVKIKMFSNGGLLCVLFQVCIMIVFMEKTTQN